MKINPPSIESVIVIAIIIIVVTTIVIVRMTALQHDECNKTKSELKELKTLYPELVKK